MKRAVGDRCRTRYPIVLVHGAGFRDLKWPVYWGRIPSALEKEGASVYYGLQDCWGSIKTNAEQLEKRIGEIISECGCEKVNIIAHSKGGLDARRAALLPGCRGKIASITTIATPHHGSKTIDRLFRAPDVVWNIASFAVNNWIRIIGDKKPDFLELCRGFTTESMDRFNEENPDDESVFYQSVGCVMRSPLSDINLSTANLVIDRIEGENDGLVTIESAEWGEDFRVIRGNGLRGISHLDAIDLRRRPFRKKKGEGVRDICQFYVELAERLKERGL